MAVYSASVSSDLHKIGNSIFSESNNLWGVGAYYPSATSGTELGAVKYFFYGLGG